MPVTGIAGTPTAQPPVQQLSQPAGRHHHSGLHGPSISDVGAQGSGVAPPSNSTGRIGGILDIRI